MSYIKTLTMIAAVAWLAACAPMPATHLPNVTENFREDCVKVAAPGSLIKSEIACYETGQKRPLTRLPVGRNHGPVRMH